MEQHLQLMDQILSKGRRKVDRTGVGTVSIFGPQIEFNLGDGFPMTTTRKIFVRGVFEELRWFLSGDTNNETLKTANVHFWDRWALKEDHGKNVDLDNHERAVLWGKKLGITTGEAVQRLQALREPEAGHAMLDNDGIPRTKSVIIARKGDLGPVYGRMWRNWPNRDGTTIDQIAYLLDNFKQRPYSRRHVVSGWNPALLPDESMDHETNILNGKQCLPPCHTVFQFIIEPLTLDERLVLFPGGEQAIRAVFKDLPADELPAAYTDCLNDNLVPKDMLSCKLYARSQDVPVGTVFNIASYAAFVHLLAHQFNMLPGRYIHSMGDAHIYTNQIDGVKEQLKRAPLKLPELQMARMLPSIFDYTAADFVISGYESHEKIDYPIAV